MDNLNKLQRRKAELQAQIEQQRSDLKQTFIEIREEIEPANLLKKAVSGALGFSKKKTGEGADGLTGGFPGPVSFLVDVLVRDPKWALGLKLLSPLAVKYWPGIKNSFGRITKKSVEKETKPPMKTRLFAKLRQGVAALRTQLKKAEKDPEKAIEQP